MTRTLTTALAGLCTLLAGSNARADNSDWKDTSDVPLPRAIPLQFVRTDSTFGDCSQLRRELELRYLSGSVSLIAKVRAAKRDVCAKTSVKFGSDWFCPFPRPWTKKESESALSYLRPRIAEGAEEGLALVFSMLVADHLTRLERWRELEPWVEETLERFEHVDQETADYFRNAYLRSELGQDDTAAHCEQTRNMQTCRLARERLWRHSESLRNHWSSLSALVRAHEIADRFFPQEARHEATAIRARCQFEAEDPLKFDAQAWSICESWTKEHGEKRP